MIKGINRQMIEVTHTGSPYFERAFFVVRGGCSDLSDAHLERLAHKMLEQADSYAGLRRRRWHLLAKRAAWSIGSAATGAGLLWIAQQLL